MQVNYAGVGGGFEWHEMGAIENQASIIYELEAVAFDFDVL